MTSTLVSYDSCDTLVTFETQLKTACRKKGLTVRSLGKKLGVSYKTAHRFITGESYIPKERARILARLLFDDQKEREWCRLKLINQQRQSKGEKRLKNDRKKALTRASKFFHARPGVTSGVRVSEQSEQIIRSFAEQEVSPFDVREIEYEGGDRSAWVVIYDRRIIRPSWSQMAIIDPEKMTLWEKVEENKMLPIDVDFSNNSDAYFAYCRKRNLGPYALLDLARDAVESSEILDEYTYESSKNLLVEKRRLDLLKNEIVSTRNWIKTGKGKKTKIINTLRYWEAEMDLWLHSVEAIKIAREKLLSFIDSQIENVRKYSH